MGILSKILRSGIVGKTAGLSGDNDFWYGLTGGPTKAGVPVNETNALKYLTVFACASLISGDLAKLPLNVYQKNKDGGKERVLMHPLSDILHTAPNPNTTSFNWRESGQSHLLLWGNKYDRIVRTPMTKQIAGLVQVTDPSGMQIKKYKNGTFYEWCEEGKKRKVAKKDMFHIPGFGFDGVFGMSMISLAREAIGLGLATENFGSTFFGNGTHPSGVMEMDGTLGDNKADFIKALKNGFAGLGKAHKIMLLENGAKYKPLTVPPNDAQFLETRNFQKIEICGMYHVPPHKIAIHGHNSDNNSLETENANYVDSCLMHWIVRWEQNIALQLLTKEERQKGLFVEFLVDGLLRGNSQARAEYYNKIFQVAGIKPNEIRAKENMNPIEGGDESFVMLNMIPLSMAGQVAEENNQDPKKEDKNLRLIEYRTKNSIMLRDRIAKQYYPLFQRAAQDIVNKEGLAVKGQINKQRKSRENRDMQTWLDDFYRKMPAEIKSKIGPVIRSFSEAIQAAAAEEMGVDVGVSDDLERFIDDYSTRYSERHTESSLGQLTALLEENLDALEERVDEWKDRRAEKIATNETVRASSAVYQAVAFGAGLSTVWRIRGPKTCPFCTSLNGKRVSSGQSFVNDGDELNPEGAEAPMKIRGLKAHPPLHQKCDCFLSI